MSAIALMSVAAAPGAAFGGDPYPQLRLSPRRKRKAESQEDSERLHKRLSLLNIEKNGQKLYVPVEKLRGAQTLNISNNDDSISGPDSHSTVSSQLGLNGDMQLDDTKYKVYIHNLDDELSSSESETDDGKLVFIDNIEKHLWASRVPRGVPVNQDGELAGMQLVLYRDPVALSVPEKREDVRQAVLNYRARVREREQLERELQMNNDDDLDLTLDPISPSASTLTPQTPTSYDPDAMDLS